MEKITTETTDQLVNKYKTTVTTVKEVDLLISDNSDLISEQFKAWYCKQAMRLGKQTFIRLASQARQEGKDKARYFSWLLKNA